MNWELLFAGKLGIVAVAGAWSNWLTSDAATSMIVTLAAIVAIVPYRIFKKHKREKPSGILDFVDRNIVEIILGTVIAPNLANTLMQMTGG